MAWIEIHQSLPNHRKTLKLAALMGVKPAFAMGSVIALWLWAIDNAPDGDLSALGDSLIGKIAGMTKYRERFAENLRAAGFIDPDMRLHDWEEYTGRLTLRRSQDKERKRRERAVGRQGCPPDVPRTSGPTEPHNTQQNPTKPHQTPPNRTKCVVAVVIRRLFA